jgi:hypothetical protein
VVGDSDKIPVALHDEIIRMCGVVNPETKRVYSHLNICKWLRREHGIKCNKSTVWSFVCKYQDRTHRLYVEALRDELRGAVKPAIDQLVTTLRRLDKLTKTSSDLGKMSGAVLAVTRALEVVAKLSGVGTPTQVDIVTTTVTAQQRREILEQRIEKLSEENVAANAEEIPGVAFLR